jgi:hypothetical protein
MLFMQHKTNPKSKSTRLHAITLAISLAGVLACGSQHQESSQTQATHASSGGSCQSAKARCELELTRLNAQMQNADPLKSQYSSLMDKVISKQMECANIGC